MLSMSVINVIGVQGKYHESNDQSSESAATRTAYLRAQRPPNSTARPCGNAFRHTKKVGVVPW